ncbi:MAG: hypothetical protein EP343_01395 [Deltaproteobacteria bacterium]|nr:MAG: hypothetical protein EP343_01395 [Deltaproteobacteria bacterium]
MDYTELWEWMKHPAPRNLALVKKSLLKTTQNYRIALGIFLCFCFGLVLLVACGQWNEGPERALHSGLIALASVSVVYLVPWYLLYRAGVGGVRRIAKDGDFREALVTQATPSVLEGSPIWVLSLEFEDRTGRLWKAKIDVPRMIYLHEAGEILPVLHHKQRPRKFLVLTPDGGISAGNSRPADENQWLRLLALGLGVSLVFVAILLLAQYLPPR